MVFFITMRDYHIHTTLCKHADGKMEEYIESAIEKGISEICFADHIPFPDGFDSEHRMALEDMETYIEQINIMKRKYREISILIGIEADYMEGYENYYERFLDSFPFDLVIMSIHYIKKWSGNQWVFNYEYTRKTLKQKYRDYFNTMIRGIRTGLFDVVGHFDLVKRPGRSLLQTNNKEITEVLDTISKVGMTIELNTSGIRRPINDIYPSLEILELAIEKGIPIVFSSDAHQPEYVGYCFDELLNHLFNYTNFHVAQYNRRKLIVQKLAQPDNDPYS